MGGILVSVLLLGGLSALHATKAKFPDAPFTVDANSKKLEAYEEKIPNSTVKFKMIPIPGGKITVPDPSNKNAPKVVEVKPMWVGKTEVTWDEYDIYLFRLDLTEEQRKAGVEAKTRPSKPYGAPDRGFGHENYPAIGISLLSATEYCKWLSLKTGKKYRLPTAAEWQFFAQAGEKKTYPIMGDDIEKIAWYWDNADDKTHDVGAKDPNPWGLYDILGNAAEWCVDFDNEGYIYGGAFTDKRPDITPFSKKKNTPDWDATDPQNPKSKWWLKDGPFVGFRVVCDP
jgi:formylglycine-generating enzyme required for sulfatase activity